MPCVYKISAPILASKGQMHRSASKFFINFTSPDPYGFVLYALESVQVLWVWTSCKNIDFQFSGAINKTPYLITPLILQLKTIQKIYTINILVLAFFLTSLSILYIYCGCKALWSKFLFWLYLDPRHLANHNNIIVIIIVSAIIIFLIVNVVVVFVFSLLFFQIQSSSFS